jgi:hypothetical protein
MSLRDLVRPGLALISLSLIAASGARAYDLPTVDNPKAQALVQRFAREIDTVEKDPSFFAFPASPMAWPCEVDQRTAYLAAGLMQALPEERQKTLKATNRLLRDMGMEASPGAVAQYKVGRLVPLRAQCKDGKLDGDVEVLAEYERSTSHENTITFQQRLVKSTMTNTARDVIRYVSRFEKGEIRGIGASYTKSFTSMDTRYDDAEFTRLTQSTKVPQSPDPMYIVLYNPDSLQPPSDAGMLMTTFMVMTTPKFGASLFGVSTSWERAVTTSVMDGMGPGRRTTRSESYKGAQLQTASVTPMKDGKPHGEQIMIMENYLKKNNLRLDQMPGMETTREIVYKGQSMLERRDCMIDGQAVKTQTCQVD